jgi:hypothetical protein
MYQRRPQQQPMFRSNHLAVVDGLVETLRRSLIGVVAEESAGSKDSMETFGVIDLEKSATASHRFKLQPSGRRHMIKSIRLGKGSAPMIRWVTRRAFPGCLRG